MLPLPYLKLAIYAAILLAGFGTGWKVHSWKADAQSLAQMEADQKAIQAHVDEVKKVEALRQANIETAALLEIERDRAAKTVERVITNDVIKYVQTPASTQCGIDPTGVRLINTAASGRLPEDTDTTSKAHASAAAVVTSVTSNYSTCNENANQLIALQDWVRAIK